MPRAYRSKAIRVSPSPLNSVKLDLGIIFTIGILLFFILESIIQDWRMQFFFLLGYGILGMGWIVFRTHRIMTQVLAERKGHGPE